MTDEALVAAFESAELAGDQFSHTEHVRVAWWYLQRSPLPEALQRDAPDCLVVFAWGYLNEIAEKCKPYLDRGGRLLTPLPEVRLMSHVNESTTT